MAKKLFSLFFLFFLGCGQAFSQEEAAGSWNPYAPGPLTTWTAPLVEKGQLVVQPFFIYNRARGVFDADGDYSRFSGGDKKYQFQQQVFMQYGLMENFEIDAQTVYQENYIKTSGNKASSSGLGDSYLYFRWLTNKEKELLPEINAIFQVKAPTGKYQKLDPAKSGTDLMGAVSGSGSWDQGIGLIATKRIKPFMLHADFILSFPNERKIDGVKTLYANYLNYDAGIEYILPNGMNLEFEIDGFIQGDRKENGSRVQDSAVNYLIISPGIGWSCKRAQWLFAYQRVVLGSNVDANDSFIITCVIPF